MDASYDQPCDGDLFISDDLSARVEEKEGHSRWIYECDRYINASLIKFYSISYLDFSSQKSSKAIGKISSQARRLNRNAGTRVPCCSCYDVSVSQLSLDLEARSEGENSRCKAKNRKIGERAALYRRAILRR